MRYATWIIAVGALGALPGLPVASAAPADAPPAQAPDAPCAPAAEAPTAPAPATEAPKAPAAEPLPPDVEKVLDAMDAAGRKIATLRAQFDYELNQTLYEDIQKRKGRLAYKAPNLLRFEFTTKPEETFVFDGRSVYHVKPATRQLVQWELRTADEKPVEALTLGKTPFPLPFGQKKEAVLEHFTVGRDAAAEKTAGKDRAVLALVPRKGTPLAEDYTRILLWINTERNLPVRARLYDVSENITTVDFHHIEMNAEVNADQFARPQAPNDWEVVEHRKADEGQKEAP